MRPKQLKSMHGFTLIELLTVVAILGVLAAIAIPQFVVHRQHAFDSMAQSDLRNAITAEEEYFAANEAYVSCASATACMNTLHGYTRSDHGVQLAIEATATSFVGTASHIQGGGGVWRFDSEGGRFVYKP